MKVKIKNLPKGFALENGKVYRDGGGTTGDQSNYGLVGVPHMDNTNGNDSPFSSVGYSLAPVPRDEANLEAEKGETVLTDMNNDGNYELYDIGGNRHHKGGTPLNLPPQSFIYSDTAKMKLNKYELHEMGVESKKRLSPAKVSKNYQLNNFISLLDSEHSDHITRDTAEYMLDKNKKSLSHLAFLQEARKKFDDGVPLAAYPYLQGKGINPLEFSQQMEQISAQEAEQKMMMQLPIEDQLQLLQMKKQQAMMMQQQQMAQQQQQQQGMPQQGGPMHQMPDGSMMPGAQHGAPPQGGGMPPQAMMPPQPPMQQPPMAKRGGQISNLPKAQMGINNFMMQKAWHDNVINNESIQDNTQITPPIVNKYEILNNNTSFETGNVGTLNSPVVPTTEQMLTQYEIINNKLMTDFTNQTNANMNAYQNQMNSMIPTRGQQMGMLGVTGATDPKAIEMWENHINQGGPPPTDPDPNYTQAYKNINGGDEPEYENDQNTPVGSNNEHVTNVYNTYNTPEEDDYQTSNYMTPSNQDDNSDEYDTTGRAKGLPLDYNNTNSPYYVGSDWSFATGGDLPRAQYNVSDNVYNQNPIVHAAESTGVYTTPEVDIVPFEENYVAGERYDSLMSKYNPTGIHMNLPTTPIDPGSIDLSAAAKQQKAMAMRNPIASIGVGLGAAYDALFGSKYGGSLPRAQYGNNGELDNSQVEINLGNRTNPDLLLTNRNFSTNEDIGYSNAMGMPNSTLQKYDGFNLGLDAINLNKSTNAFINSDFLDRGNNVANLDYMGGINVSGDGLRGYAEGRAGIGLGMGNKPHDWIVERGDGTTYNTGIQKTNPLSYINPYISGVAGLDFGLNDTDSFGLQGSYNTPLSPYGKGLGARLNLNKGNFGVNVGTENILNNPQTTFGASYSFKNGGYLPKAQTNISDSEYFPYYGALNQEGYEGPTYKNSMGTVVPKVDKSGNVMYDDGAFVMANPAEHMQTELVNYHDPKMAYWMDQPNYAKGRTDVNMDVDAKDMLWDKYTEAEMNAYNQSKTEGNDNAIDNFDNTWGRSGSAYARENMPTDMSRAAQLSRGETYTDDFDQTGPLRPDGTFRYGGDLPIAKDGIEYPKGSGTFYSKREMNKLRKSKDPTKIALYNDIRGIDTRTRQEIANDQTSEINKSRQNTAAVTLEDQVFSGGTDDWATDYLADSPQAEEYRKSRYDAYVDRRKSQGKDVIGEQEYHNAYATMQQHNAYFEKNLTQEQRNTKDWDDGTNDKYHASLENSGMSPLTDDMVGHVQSGYIGGQALALTGDEYTDFMQSGVKDQSVFGLAISPEDEKFGNTTNDQRESYTRNNSTEEIACTNAEGMEAACVEIGGTWTPWNEETKTGCSCDKQIPTDKIPPPETPTKDTPFWLQDELGMANALDAKMSLKKRYPWAPQYNQIGIDGVFDDPTREIAAIGEQAAIATSAATAFGGPQRGIAAALATQGKAMTAIADTVNKVHSNNIKVGNDLNVKNAEMEYKTQMLNNNELKQLYDNTVLTEENYDNSVRKANAAITKQVQAAYTNRANTANLNSIYPQFDIDPASGGMLANVNNKTFHADPNYVDPKTYDENYAKQIEMLRTNKVPENLWPKYTPPGAPNSNNSFAKQNASVITNSGYQGQQAGFGRETGRKNRILRKGGQLRNWFSPLRGN